MNVVNFTFFASFFFFWIALVDVDLLSFFDALL